MKIWLINNYANVPGEPGGTRHFAFARQWADMGHETVIIGSSYQHMQRRQRLAPGEWHRVEVVDGVRLLWLRAPSYRATDARRVASLVVSAVQVHRTRRLLGGDRPDVVVGSSPDPLSAAAGAALARRLGVPFVWEIRDLWPETLIQLGDFTPRHPAIRGLARVERLLAARAAAVVSVLPGAGEYLRAHVRPDVDVTWVPNGVELDAVGPMRAYPNGEGLTFVYAGSHGTANALDVIVDAAALLQAEGRSNGLTVRLVGDGPEKQALQRRAAGLRFVRFEEPRPKSGVFDLLAESGAFLYVFRSSPLYRWGYSPNKLWDYMAAGRPVVLASSGPYDPVSDAQAGLTVPAGDPGAVAGAMRRLAEMSASERAQLGRNGRSYVEQHHAVPKLAGRFADVLARVTGV